MLAAMFGRRNLILPGLIVYAAAMFFTGINWGLPSRASDQYLFGSQKPWTGQQIMDLAGSWDTTTSRGADIAMHPLEGRDKPVVLNDTDARRAEIVRRYRLYSSQPDEMITFRSLSRMKPSRLDFDPAMYQYGGLWIYPVGALLKLASLFHLVTLRTDLAFYLDHPEAFARFYLVARCYSAMWGLIGVTVIYTLGRELSGNILVGAAAAALYASMPVVIDLAHEAKPHLAGTVLTMQTILMGVRYVRTGNRKWWMLASLLAGASAGMVLTGCLAFLVLVAMEFCRLRTFSRTCGKISGSIAIGLVTFFLTNPYLLYNAATGRNVVHSNVGNYGNFYHPGLSLSGLGSAVRAIADGMSIAPMLVGIAGVIVLTMARLIRFSRRRIELAGCGELLAVPAISLLALIVVLGEGKTAEYARFALTLDIMLAVSAALLIGRLRITDREKLLLAGLLVAGTFFFGVRYDINFVADSKPNSTRQEAAQILQGFYSPPRVLDVWAEPAPYCMPPVDLFTWQIVLQPPGAVDPKNVGIRAVDYATRMDPLDPPRVLSPISWANKPFEISKPSPVSTRRNRP